MTSLKTDKNLINWAKKHYNAHSIPTAKIACARLKGIKYKYFTQDEKGMKNTVRFNAILVFAVADAPSIEAKRLNEEETRLFLLKNNLNA